MGAKESGKTKNIHALELHNAGFSYGVKGGGYEFFREVSIQTRRNEIFCIIGPSGCGCGVYGRSNWSGIQYDCPQQDYLNTPGIIALVIRYSILAIGLDQVIRRIEIRLTHWTERTKISLQKI